MVRFLIPVEIPEGFEMIKAGVIGVVGQGLRDEARPGMNDAPPVQKLDGGRVSRPVADQEMQRAHALGDPYLGLTSEDFLNGAPVVKLVLDPLKLHKRRPLVGRRIPRFVQPHQLYDEALLVHPSHGEFPADLIKRQAAEFRDPAYGPLGRHEQSCLSHVPLVDHQQAQARVVVEVLAEKESLAVPEDKRGAGRSGSGPKKGTGQESESDPKTTARGRQSGFDHDELLSRENPPGISR